MTRNPAVKLQVIRDSGGKAVSREPDDWIRSVELELIEADLVIGTAELHVFNADGADATGESLHDMCDAHSSATYNCGVAVYNMRRSVNEFRVAVRRKFRIGLWDSLNVLLISLIKIEPAYRGREIGLTALSRMIKKWGKGCSLAVMKPYPLQYCGKDAEATPEYKSAYRKLVRYYAPLCFTKIPYRNGSLEHGGGHYGLRL